MRRLRIVGIFDLIQFDLKVSESDSAASTAGWARTLIRQGGELLTRGRPN